MITIIKLIRLHHKAVYNELFHYNSTIFIFLTSILLFPYNFKKKVFRGLLGSCFTAVSRYQSMSIVNSGGVILKIIHFGPGSWLI